MAYVKKEKKVKVKHLIRVDKDDDTFIVIHAAEHGNTYQHFVEHAIKKEIKFLKEIAEQKEARKNKKLI